MRILQLCNKFPYPLKDGAAIASTYLAKAYAELGHEVALLSMNTSKHWFDTATLPKNFDHYTAIHTVFVDNRIRPIPAFLNLFSERSYHVERFVDGKFSQKMKRNAAEQAFRRCPAGIPLPSALYPGYPAICAPHAGRFAGAQRRTRNLGACCRKFQSIEKVVFKPTSPHA